MSDELHHDILMHYLDRLVPPREPEMQEMEKYAEETHFPIIGPSAGYFCYQIARLIHARRVFEMGSGYGYSTAWFARAVQENGGGKVYHTVWKEDLSNRARRHLSALGYDELMEFRVNESVQALRETEGPFDLIFNDIDKQDYLDSLPVINEKLRPGGVLLVDNLLWHGRVFNGNDHSPSTEAIRKFTLAIMSDPTWTASIVPIRDGLLLAYKTDNNNT